MESANAGEDHRLYHMGEGTTLETPGVMHGAEEIWVGSGVGICNGFRFLVTTPVTGERPKIVIGDGVQADVGLTITAAHSVILEPNVWCGPRVTVTDSRPTWRHTGLPISRQPQESPGQGVLIGEGACLGPGSVVEGPVTIGKGCYVGAGCVVREDVPDYAVVSGNPARITELFDTQSMGWMAVSSDADVAAVLRQRRDKPLLSVCIPTYNRSKELAECLDTLLPQTSENGLVEVCVADNASEDDTPAVLARYAERYPQLRVLRRAENIGGERNYLEIVKMARGKYVKLQGDDDFMVPGALQPILYAVLFKGCRLVFIDVLRSDGSVQVLEGMDTFMREVSLAAGFITSIVADRDALLALPQPDQFIGTNLNHVYWLYGLLREDPRFCLVKASIFRYAYNMPRGYNFGETAIAGYLRILSHFVGKGLSPDAYTEEKKRLLDLFVIPRLEMLIASGRPFEYDGFEDVFTAHYRAEPYYEEYLQEVQRILALPGANKHAKEERDETNRDRPRHSQ